MEKRLYGSAARQVLLVRDRPECGVVQCQKIVSVFVIFETAGVSSVKKYNLIILQFIRRRIAKGYAI